MRNIIVPAFRYTVKERYSTEGCVAYMLEDELGGETVLSEEYLELIPRDITERIKTFDDACRWCDDNDERDFVNEYTCACTYIDSDDIIAYLKLRIITAALNEGWEPTHEQPEELWWVIYNWNDNQYTADWYINLQPIPRKLALKSKELAQYAAKQFRDIYADFCCCKKGGPK